MLAAKGLTSKEIARQLGIAPSTVDTHLNAAMLNLNIGRRADLERFMLAQENSVNLPGEDINLIEFSNNEHENFDEMYVISDLKSATSSRDNLGKLFLYSFLTISGLMIMGWILFLITWNLLHYFS